MEIHILSLHAGTGTSRMVQNIVLSRPFQTLLTNAGILQWSPEVIESEAKQMISLTGNHLTAWLLLSDGIRMIALSVDLPDPEAYPMFDVTTLPQSANPMADYQFGDQYGKVTFAEFVFDHRHAIVLFEMNTQASILSLTRPERYDVPNTKLADSRGLAQSANGRYLALLLRFKGQDQIAVVSLAEDSIQHTIFNIPTMDAQGLRWSPDGEPVIAVWDTAAYGPSVSFFTAMGHCLMNLELSTSAFSLLQHPLGVQGTGVTCIEWSKIRNGYVLVVADGHGQIVIRGQQPGAKEGTVTQKSGQNSQSLVSPLAWFSRFRLLIATGKFFQQEHFTSSHYRWHKAHGLARDSSGAPLLLSVQNRIGYGPGAQRP